MQAIQNKSIRQLLNTIAQGDCIEAMRQMPANTVDFILSDPPYLVNYRDRSGRTIQNDANADWLKPAMKEAYRVLKQNRVDGEFVGSVKVMVTNPVYSRDRQHVLIPEGTFILGNAQKVSGFGQKRLAVAFHRMIMPDGYNVDLDQFAMLALLGVLVVGCASPSPSKKPSPYHYTTNAPLLTLGAKPKEPS